MDIFLWFAMVFKFHKITDFDILPSLPRDYVNNLPVPIPDLQSDFVQLYRIYVIRIKKHHVNIPAMILNKQNLLLI